MYISFWPCRFTFPSLILVFMVFDTLAIGENSTSTTSFSCVFICCVSPTCSLLYDASVQWNVVLQFRGLNRQYTQCISLLHNLRYLVRMSSNYRLSWIMSPILLKNLVWLGILAYIGWNWDGGGACTPTKFYAGVSIPPQNLTAAGAWFRHSWLADQWRGNVA